MGIALVIKSNEFKYWFYSDVRGPREPKYPITGKVEFDNFEGRWGDRAELNKFLQGYAVEKAKLESRKAGHVVTEQLLVDGSIKLTVQVGGVA